MVDEKVSEVPTSRTLESKELTRSRFYRHLYTESNIHKADKLGLDKDL
jgi:hypothetical protein